MIFVFEKLYLLKPRRCPISLNRQLLPSIPNNSEKFTNQLFAFFKGRNKAIPMVT